MDSAATNATDGGTHGLRPYRAEATRRAGEPHRHGNVPLERRAIMKGKTLLALSALLAACEHPLGPSIASTLAGSSQTTFSGHATGIIATIAGVRIPVAETGELDPQAGGNRKTTLLDATIPGSLTNGLVVASAQVLHATTIGQGDRSRSEVAVADLDLTISTNQIGAQFLAARAQAVCQAGAAVVGGSSELARLVINGQEIAITGEENQTINLAGLKVVINEQTRSGSGNHGDLTVRAIHVTAYDLAGGTLADVVVAEAHADITCQGAPDCASAKDFVTGGGWIMATSDRGTFGVAGGFKNGWWGHLTYIDHGMKLKIKGIEVTNYTVTDTRTRHIDGFAEVNGAGRYGYHVDVTDNGEPGRDDRFYLKVDGVYQAGGTLEGGNIQLHGPCQ
jgi:hypothetical protein